MAKGIYVYNDGCAILSEEAMEIIARKLGLDTDGDNVIYLSSTEIKLLGGMKNE